jgi:hypothetical protein
MLREVALRVLPGKASALGVERLWSGAKLTLVDNRRSLLTPRLMQLLKLKMNMGLLTDIDENLIEALGVRRYLEDDELFDSIFEDLEAYERVETWEGPATGGVNVVCEGEVEDEEETMGSHEEEDEEEDDPFAATADD